MSLELSHQFIFVVETNESAQTDKVYISYLLKGLYGDYFSNNSQYAYKYSFVYMEGKRNFNKKHIKTQISALKNEYHSKSSVIYVIDTDNPTNENKTLNENILKYCELNNYKLIYFAHNIENIFYPNEKIIDKIRLKKQFASHQPKINTIKTKLMNKKYFIYNKGTSNFLFIMNEAINNLIK